MKNILLILAFVLSGFSAYGATPVTRSGPRTSNSVSAVEQQSNDKSSGLSTGARAAVRSQVRGSSVKGGAGRTSSGAPSTAAPAQNVGTRGRAAAVQPTTVAARAAKQNVISTGTKVATANQNTAVDEVCWNKFSGCMDSFCMLDNISGGRCTCSDKNAEYDSILAEIQELDNQSYQMATVGVERIEMGDDADAVMARTKEITSSIEKDAEKNKSKRKSLDLSSWNTIGINFDDEDIEDVFSLSSDGTAIANKTGDALYRASAKLCVAQIPECKSQDKIMELMYQQRIRSDCTAYENSLRQQRTQSAQKLAAAQSAMREAALEQYRSANKYDLGQCTVQFKKCMQTTGGCGDDFTGCITQQTTREMLQKGSVKTKKIKGASTTIEIAAWSYDALESKKPLCMTVTKECVNVRDQVWDTFLREVAPQVKSAELIAESDLRTSCISTISECFQKACRDNMDPNDPDGSYDMCLTRPDTLRSVCKVQIDPCEGAEPKIMDYVRARLASMRVDSCTKEFKDCLQSEDRCGSDYSQCVGLDTDTIVRMCPAEKLVGCQYEYGENKVTDVYDELSKIAQGIFLSIDNNMLDTCQKAANAAMIKVCGSTEDCDELVVDENLGARSLEYKICEYTPSTEGLDISYNLCRTDVSQIQDSELGRDQSGATRGLGTVKDFAGVIDGTIYWQSVEFNDDGNIDVAKYWNTVEKDEEGNEIVTEHREKINSELAVLQRNINLAVQAIESDPKVQYCMTGREVEGVKIGEEVQTLGRKGEGQGRFPNLTEQMRLTIANSALKIAKDTYYKKYDELNAKILKDYATIGERMASIIGENSKDARREIARQACVNMADFSSLPQSPEPPKNSAGTLISIAGVAAALVFTGGAAGVAILPALTTVEMAGIAAAGAAVGIGAGVATSRGTANGEVTKNTNLDLIGTKSINQWNYKETITSTFDWENLNCHKCVRSTNCKVTKNPLFGNKYCKTWDEEKESCTDTQF
ncbi:MAG: hypothetical protein J5742_00970 [Alphaproteobacteria bacterium]|nr:hypothetical protein [Alphaproteobacteria bacterium]